MKLYEQPKVQKLIDATYEIAMRLHAGELAGRSREDVAEWVRVNLAGLGFPTEAVGMSWGVLR